MKWNWVSIRRPAIPTPGDATCATTSSRSTRTSASIATGASRFRRETASCGSAELELDEDGAPRRWTEVPAADPDAATYIWIDADQCIRCGNCINVCPVDAISLRKCDCVAENW